MTDSDPASARGRARLGPVSALLLTSGWLVAESVYAVAAESAVPWRALPVAIGVGVPWAAALALLIIASDRSWGRLSGTPSGIDAAAGAVRRFVGVADPTTSGRRSAALVTALLLAFAWGLAGYFMGERIETLVARPEFGRPLFLLILAVLAAILAASSAALAYPMSLVFARLVPLPVIGFFARPSGILALLGFAGLGSFAAFWVFARDTARAIPWAFVVGPASGALAALGAGAIARRPRAFRPFVWATSATALVLAAAALLLPRSASRLRVAFLGTGTVTRLWFAAASPLLDFDHDGALGVYAGGDCAPHNPKIGPLAMEIPNNKIDENCSGGDLVFDKNRFKTGKVQHPIPPNAPSRPHVIFVTTDALSHSHTTLGGYKRNTTPELADWAKRATVFDWGFAVAPSTRFSFPVLLAGVYNSQVHLSAPARIPYGWEPQVLTMAEVFATRGYRTIAIPGDRYFTATRWSGFTQGFQTVDTGPLDTAKDYSHPSPEMTRAAIAHIEATKETGQPLFLWIHYYDEHPPYSVPMGGQRFGTSEVDRYDSELSFADRQWGELFRAIERTWKPEEYVIVFTSDHGEAFDEDHKVEHHNVDIHTELLHVPFIVQTAARRGERLPDLVWHADIFPTLANLLGAGARPEWMGESLLPVLFSGKHVEKDVIYSLLYLDEAVRIGLDPFRMIGVRTKDVYYYEDRVHDDKRLVHFTTDPLDHRDLTSQEPQLAEMFRYLAAQKVDYLRRHEDALTRFYKTPTPTKPPPTRRR